ncbi:hypothetical protein IT575_12010 [bacterium]|nr:hypothetical protein [bacterium]
MFKVRLAAGIIAGVLLVLSAVSALALSTAQEAWNGVAAKYHFDTVPAPASATFDDIYHGGNISSDLPKAWWEAFGTGMVPPSGDDTVNFWIN